ncbi:hypothetical protein FA15DRAFT_711902 [Coprinopsis marcescibilis]|uniref:Uncharacterized protein n=1 Tax=Coprinopsis marcescibilis TaxID=230819 RepID=A0A5C3K8H2_COPMA|nr:hypothetical protein FA15DRAFT_711902 [Coprinopsis marcescibilis]
MWLECGSGTAPAAWLGGFAAILKWKTDNNFNWMIHERNMEEDDEDEQEEEE